MADKRECEPVTSETARAEAPSHSPDEELPRRTRLTPQAARLALATPSNDNVGIHPSETTTTESSAVPASDAVATDSAKSEETAEAAEPSARKRRAIFSDDGEDGEEDDLAAQVFSVDTEAVAATEATMQPEREGIVPRVNRRGTLGDRLEPLRARRALNLMDRLEADGDQHEGGDDDSLLVVRRTSWKRRLTSTTISETETETTANSDQELVLLPPPSGAAVGGRPAFARAHSSQSVLLAPPRMSFARSTSTAGGDEGYSASSAAPKIHTLVLPTVRSRSHPDLNVIAPQTVADLLTGIYSDRLDSYTLIDCRFDYEFAGGSLKGAVSMNDPGLVEEHFLRKPPSNSTRTALIFYCEFSANRAPKMLRHVRNLDRWIHAERYPELFYPELYLIDGGYKNCFETLEDVICHRAKYQTMSDKAFVDQCKRDFATHRANWKLHKSNACASKFQQVHRRIHDVFGDDSSCDPGRGDEDLLAHPVSLRSFSQQL